LVTRIHHCYADGIALIQVMLSMTHPTAAGSLAMKPETFESAASGEADFWAQLLKPLAGALGGAKGLGKDLLERGKAFASDPAKAADALSGYAGKGMELAGEVAKLVTMGSDAQTRFKGTLGTRKTVAWADPLPLSEVKAVGKALGCSINDVLLSMAAGALRDYLIEKGDSAHGVEIRAIVPVNLRPVGDGHKLGNHFGLVFLDLPLGVEHPLERLYEVRRRMQALKGSYQPVIALALLSAVGYGPSALQDQVTRLLGANASAVMTNVPGPQHPLYFAGRRIAELDFWVPQSGGIGMGVSILSYDGRIQFGVITDAGLVPDPHRIVDRFGDEFDKLLWLTLMSPWGPAVAAEPAAEAGPDRPTAAAVPESPGTQSPRKKKTPETRIPKRFRNL
jgi:WS/DGAT/MGAT family acyltransferase